jgi:hypothetical protein
MSMELLVGAKSPHARPRTVVVKGWSEAARFEEMGRREGQTALA